MEVYLVLLVALLLGGVAGWVARKPLFGGALTGAALVGLLLTLVAGKLWLHGPGDDLDGLLDVILGVLLYIGALIACVIIGVIGLGAMLGAALRRAVSS